jgi:ribonuclease VapC
MLLGEPGGDQAAAQLSDGHISVVNVIEVLTRLVDGGMQVSKAEAFFAQLDLQVVDLDTQQAVDAASLRAATRHRGLSLGDRACLALARREGLPVLTADRQWQGLDVGVDIRLIR